MNGQCNNDEEQLGVVLLWTRRAPLGHYGYLTPIQFEPSYSHLCFFNADSMVSPAERIADGDLVRYRVQQDAKGYHITSLQLEKFQVYDRRIDFNEIDISICFPGIDGHLLYSSGPVFTYLREKFSKRLLSTLREYEDEVTGNWVTGGYFIARRLNAIMRGPLIYRRELFANVKLRNRTKELLERNPEGYQLRFLNRLLLEDAIKSEFETPISFTDISSSVFQGRVCCSETSGKEVLNMQIDNPDKYPAMEVGFFCCSVPDESFIPLLGSRVEFRIHKIIGRKGWLGVGLMAYDIWEIAQEVEVLPAITELTNPVQTALVKAVPAKAQKNSIRKDTNSDGLQYDLGAGKIVLPNGIRISVPIRYASVLEPMVRKVPGKASERISELNHDQVALCYENGRFLQKVAALEKKLKQGKITEDQLEAKKRDLQVRLKETLVKIKGDNEFATKRARQWRRDLERWLKKKKLEGHDLINKRPNFYGLGSGWDYEKFAKGDGEAGLIKSVGRASLL